MPCARQCSARLMVLVVVVVPENTCAEQLLKEVIPSPHLCTAPEGCAAEAVSVVGGEGKCESSWVM